MATELVKGYTRASVSPVKIYLKNAYDSIEWSFLEMMLLELGFPELFTGWVMACVQSVSYSIIINGSPTKPSVAKKGLRQGALAQSR